MALDRGMDEAEFIFRMKHDGYLVVVRIKNMDRDVFGNGRTIDDTLSEMPFRKAHLNTYRGVRTVELRFAQGVMQYCADPHSKDAVTHETKLMVVESKFDGKSICLYVVCPDEVIANPDLARKYAIRAAQAYCDRWQIETSFQNVKREFRLEEARVHSLLAGLRELYNAEMVRNITGRPRKERIENPAQLLFQLE